MSDQESKDIQGAATKANEVLAHAADEATKVVAAAAAEAVKVVKQNQGNSTESKEFIILTQEVKYLRQDVNKMAQNFENLSKAFVTQAAFDNVRIAVMGVTNDGGLLKRVDELEKSQAERKGSWSTIQVIWTVGIAIIMGVLAYIAARGH